MEVGKNLLEIEKIDKKNKYLEIWKRLCFGYSWVDGGYSEVSIRNVKHKEDIKELQAELIKLQNWVYDNKKRVTIIFEDRDTAGKGKAIKRFIQYLNPRRFRVAALPKPTEVETGQFYFQHYFKHLPDPGEIVFFDKSWYNRAIIEPTYGFCSDEQYEKFMKGVPEIEHALIDDGIILIKFWFSISKDTSKSV